MIKIVIISTALGVSGLAYSIFEHDSAVYAGQHNQWPKAMDYMKKAVAHNPLDATVVYDAGVASYRVGDFAQAQAYFHQAASTLRASCALQERAYFNEGNAHAQLHQYQEAATCYERTLEINPTNQLAKDNLALMKKILEQQQQEQQKNNSQQDDTDNNQTQNPEKHDENETQENTNERDQQQDENNKTGEDNKESQSSDTQEKKDGNNNVAGNVGDNQKQQGGRGGQEKEDVKSMPHQEERKAQSQKAISESQQSKDTQQQQLPDGAPQPQPVDAWLDKILAQREQEDAALHKKLVKARVAQQSKGQQDARVCW